jgi:cytoskeletal protein CcmA (bactofilin family)
MSAVAFVGPAIRIKGQVIAREPLTIAGTVDGSIAVEGHPVTIAAGGRIVANIVADEIVVGGDVKGQLDASTRIRVNETATIEGDMTAPKVSVADGAKFQGKVKTANKEK